MKKIKRTKYTDEPLGELKVVKDFLPSPDELVLKDETVKITLSLTKSSIDFFKQQAKQHHTQYQKMIRALLDQYSSYYGSQEFDSNPLA
jgi:predicted DNA binding CopG/RHH family protein